MPAFRAVRELAIVSLCVLLIWAPLYALPRTRNEKPFATTVRPRPQAITRPHRAGEMLVKFRAEAQAGQRSQIIDAYGKRSNRLRGRGNLDRLTIKDGLDLADVLYNVRQLNAAIEWAEPNYVVAKNAQGPPVPNDPRFGSQWALRNTGQNGGDTGADIGATHGWETTTGSRETIVAVIDTGVDTTHRDLIRNLWRNRIEVTGRSGSDDDRNGYTDDVAGWNFVADTSDVTDDNGHGTEMAGIIAAQGNNNLGISGVMWRVAIMPLKALDSGGSGSIADVVEAIDYASQNHAAVISCSFGTGGFSQALLEAINRASISGTLVVSSAGNNGEDITQSPYYPASYSAGNLISVAATTNTDELAPFSNWSPGEVEIAAPGVAVETTQQGGGYTTVTGTSASAPLVAGVAGLLKTLRPWISAQTVRLSLIAGVRSSPYLTGKVLSNGIVNAGGAITAFMSGKHDVVGGSGGPGGGGGGQTGAPGIDGLRNHVPGPPEPHVSTNSLPPPGYDDPKPAQTANFNAYLTEITKAHQTSGIAGSTPFQKVDPTAGNTTVGGISVNLSSGNVSFTAPVLSLAGRAGLNLDLALTYNSKVWNKTGSTMFFNADKGFPAPGWRIGFGAIQALDWTTPYTNSVTGKQSVIYIAPDGTRRDLAYNSATSRYESYDSSYLEFNWTTRVLRTSGGMEILFADTATSDGQFLPTRIRDRNGNVLNIFYRNLDNGDRAIDYIIDTAGRRIDFYYQSNRLLEVRQNRAGTWFKYVVLDYEPVTLHPYFHDGYVGIDSGTYWGQQVYVPSRITYPTGQHLRFYYTSYAQMYLIEKWVPTISGQGTERRVAYTRFNFPSHVGASYPANPLVTWQYTQPIDCPTFTFRGEMAENWQAGGEHYYQYLSDGSIMDPSGRRFLLGTTGLTLWTYLYPPGSSNYTKVEEVEYTKDTGPSYNSNLRVLETRITDLPPGGSPNLRKTRLSYIQRDGMWLPENKDEYQGYTGTVYRRTVTEYTSYPGVRVLGLPSQVSVYSGPGTTLMSRMATLYDETGTYLDSNNVAAPFFIDASGAGVIQRDSGYGASFTERGNPTSIVQYSVVGGAASAPRITKRISYDTNGNVRSQSDGAGNRLQFNLTDNYSNKPAGTGETHVYAYTAEDPTGFRKGSQYEYYTGHVTTTFNMVSGSGTQLQLTTYGYEFADRLLGEWRPDGGYFYHVYYDSLLGVGTFQKTDEVNGQAQVRYKLQLFDGAGRVIKRSNDHPDGIVGKYSAQQLVYDQLGRELDVSKVIAVDGVWAPVDGDSWTFSHLSYDELSRLKLLTHADSNTRSYDYSGCGCAGSATTTVVDEMGHRTISQTDFLGRLSEAIEYSPYYADNVYSKAVYVYDALDRVVAIHHSSSGGVATQSRSFAYDGYGRVQQEVTPEGGTVSFTYKPNDLVETSANQRGMVTTHAYNTRNLVTGISYNDGTTPAVSFSYDDFGARQTMTDGEGATSYTYNAFRQLASETRTFTGLPGKSFTLGYQYNSVNQPKRITTSVSDGSFTKNVNYAYNPTGALSGIGTNLIGSDPNATTNVASQLTYRGFGGLRQMTYGNGRRLRMGYSSSRQQLTSMIVDRTNGTDQIVNHAYEYGVYDSELDVWRNNGRIRKIWDYVDTAFNVEYSYDDYDRLTGALSSAYARGYSYNPWGNLRQVWGWGGEASSYTLNYASNGSGAPATNRILNVNGTIPVAHDAAGNLTQEGSTTYSYDAANRLKEVGTGGQNIYGYDGDGNRVRKVSNGTNPLFMLRSSVLGQVVLEMTETNVAVRVYIYAGGKQIALKGPDANFYWTHWDHLGSTHKMTRGDGSVAYRAEYDPHGQRILEWSDIGVTTLNSHKFTGHEWDWATNLEYANARMYSHNRARFMQPYPIGLKGASLSNPQTLNRYAYVNNDPVNYLDPDGKFGISFVCFLIDYGWYEDGYWWAEFRCYGPPSAPPQPLPGPEPSPPTPCSGIGGFSEGIGRFTADELNDAAIAVFGEMTAQQHPAWRAEARAVASAIFTGQMHYVREPDQESGGPLHRCQTLLKRLLNL